MKRMFKKSISLFAAGIMLVSAFGGVAALADGELYTTHLWETMEDGTSAESNTKTTISTIENGKYGKGIKVNYTTTATERVNAQAYFDLKDTITVAEAIEKNLTVEVEFDYYYNGHTDKEYGNNNYFYLSSKSLKEGPENDAAVGFRIRTTGQTKILNYPNSTEDDVKNAESNEIKNFNRFKVVLHAEKAGYIDPLTSTATTADGWVLDGFYYNGAEQKNQAKYTLGGYTGGGDFTNLYFKFQTDSTLAGEIGLDNVSVVSYTTPADGVSPVPDRRAYMEKVLTYKDTASAGSYNNALSVFEQDYITEADMNQAYYILEGRSDLYVIDDIYNGSRSVKITSNDSIGGTPILIVASFVSDKLDDIMIKTIAPIASGSSATISFDEDFTVADKASLRAYIFESFETLLPLATSRVE